MSYIENAGGDEFATGESVIQGLEAAIAIQKIVCSDVGILRECVKAAGCAGEGGRVVEVVEYELQYFIGERVEVHVGTPVCMTVWVREKRWQQSR
jgi:hypothetical protein